MGEEKDDKSKNINNITRLFVPIKVPMNFIRQKIGKVQMT